MDFIFYILMFFAAVIMLAISSRVLVESLEKVALFLRVREFVIAFFLMAFGASIPNLVVGIISAMRGMPELSFGDVVGGNIFDLSIVLGLAVLISRDGLDADSRTVQASSMATIFFAIMPILMAFDGQISRMDGLIMFLGYFAYTGWMFSGRCNITREYSKSEKKPKQSVFFSSFVKSLIALVALIAGGYMMVESAVKFSKFFGLELGIIGVFVVALGNCMPETFFSMQASRKGQGWMVLGDLMGGVVFCASALMGLVAMIHPIAFKIPTAMIVPRIFLIIVCVAFLLSVRSDRKITKKEGLGLVLFYVLFTATEILLQNYFQTMLK